MLQQWLVLFLLAESPPHVACSVAHVPAGDVAHEPEAGLDPWLDPATAELVNAPKPRIERRVGDDGARVDIDIPEALVTAPLNRCEN